MTNLDHSNRRHTERTFHNEPAETALTAPTSTDDTDAPGYEANRAAETLNRIGSIFEQVLTSQQTQLELLHDQVAELMAWKADTDNQPDAASTPAVERMRWEDMTGTEAAQAWQRLITWVDWAVAEFDLYAVLPPCWAHPDHRRLRRELSALMVAYSDLVVAPQATKGGEMTFLAWLHAALGRWQAYDRGGCAQRGHERAGRLHTGTTWPTTWMVDARVEADRDIAARADRAQRPSGPTGGGEAA